jgi:hypothetical protein
MAASTTAAAIATLDTDVFEPSGRVLVLQTGNMREKNIGDGVDSFARAEKDGCSYFNHDDILHRFLLQEIEAKYEAVDFVTKFNLGNKKFFNIYDDTDHRVSLGVNSHEMLILENVTIVVAIGSSSTQAFKVTKKRVIQLLPISNLNRSNKAILGNREDPNLGVESMSKFGGKSTDETKAQSVVDFIHANAVDKSGNKTNVIFVNQIGYSVLGFNPRGADAPVPTKDQKVVSIADHDGFTTNGGKTGLIAVLQKIAKTDNITNFFLVARQCKANDATGIELDISGQWATCIDQIQNEPSMLINPEEQFDSVIDLGGSSGTSYTRTVENYPFNWLPIWTTTHYTRDKTFMNSAKRIDFMKEKGNTPNDFVGNMKEFVAQFNREMFEMV